jgi:hypothetical protein
MLAYLFFAKNYACSVWVEVFECLLGICLSFASVSLGLANIPNTSYKEEEWCVKTT